MTQLTDFTHGIPLDSSGDPTVFMCSVGCLPRYTFILCGFKFGISVSTRWPSLGWKQLPFPAKHRSRNPKEAIMSRSEKLAIGDENREVRKSHQK